MKKVLVLIILFVLSSCITKYETDVIFTYKKYNYTITYPVSKHNEWVLFYGATDATIYKLEDGDILHTIAILTRQPLNLSGSIEIFLLDEDGKVYTIWIKDLKTGKLDFPYIIEDFSNTNIKKLNIPYSTFKKLYKENIDKKSLIEIFVNIGENKILVFTFNNKNNKKLEKEIYKIITSLTREKINNQNNNAKQ